jgi:hypothetical protein
MNMNINELTMYLILEELRKLNKHLGVGEEE